MKNPHLYAHLEQLPLEWVTAQFPQPFTLGSTLGQRLSQWVQTLWLWSTGSREPRIVEKYTPEGQCFYEVYDPVSDRRQSFATAQAVRQWLEQRYYQG
ncbi:hypothetical protein [Prochlorothrix hollandica]|uniref:Uncharacterized protein n=1 Tax=Prochlorothrix hollandica PCC 9006 = CALU 1027 TaxID=317619 RepID=A0A0M2PXR7_PROHO|nr:hypothetical protein [Prochlorothrix hollandica]KKI99872.1 hypothetical protein PROH_08580 [Prochlorothrix hollandica PCC 9006 = CALU 1027]